MKPLRQSIPTLLALLLLASASGCANLGGDNQQSFAITLMHVNDTHSRIEDLPGETLTINGVATRVDMAGMPRLAAKVKAVRAENANTLLLHAGDAVQGTLYFSRYHGTAEFDFLNEMGVDAMVIGNHEFDKGAAYLADFIGYADFPMISANIDASGSPELAGRIAPFTIITVGNEKIGIIGLTTASTAVLSSPGDGIVFKEEAATAERYVTELESTGINKIIALTHLGYDEDVILARMVPGIDIIVGGHTHTLLGGDALRDIGLLPAGSYPTLVENPEGDPVYIVQSWEKGKVLGILNVTFDGDGKITATSGNPVLLVDDNFEQIETGGDMNAVDAPTRAAIMEVIDANNSIEVVREDASAQAIRDTYKPGIDRMQNEVIARAGENLYHTRIPGADSLGAGVSFPSGSHIAPHVAGSMLWKVNHGGNRNADLAIKAGGGVRTGIPRGKITVGNAYELMPFENTLVVVELTGAEVKAAIQGGVTTAVSGLSDGAFPYVADVRYIVDAATDPKHPKVTRVEIRNADGAWTAIADTAAYRIVVDSYLADGGDFYSVIGNAAGYRYDTGFTDVEAFMEYAREKGVLNRLDENGVTWQTGN